MLGDRPETREIGVLPAGDLLVLGVEQSHYGTNRVRVPSVPAIPSQKTKNLLSARGVALLRRLRHQRFRSEHQGSD
jgi:hypothetical protein